MKKLIKASYFTCGFILIVIILAFSTFILAHNEVEVESHDIVDMYIQDIDIVLQLLGTSKYYTYRCGSLTISGEFYKDLAIKTHDIDMNTIKYEALFQEGFLVATTYPSCKALWYGLDELGLGFLFTKPKQNEVA